MTGKKSELKGSKAGKKAELPQSGEALADLIDPEKPETKGLKSLAPATPHQKELPKLGHKQIHFESPDGRIYVGPFDAPSIPDPLHHGREINPMRGASAQKRS